MVMANVMTVTVTATTRPPPYLPAPQRYIHCTRSRRRRGEHCPRRRLPPSPALHRNTRNSADSRWNRLAGAGDGIRRRSSVRFRSWDRRRPEFWASAAGQAGEEALVSQKKPDA
jgi:hypothetical protein